MIESKAAVLYEVPGRPRMEVIQVSDPGENEVRVRTAAVGLCHSDLNIMEGLHTRPLPSVLGHEGSGIVESVGSNVDDLQVGDHVVACLSVFCGHCKYCLAGRMALCERSGLGRAPGAGSRLRHHGMPVHAGFNIGAFSEYMLVHRNALVRIPDAIPLDVAALLGCAVVTGMGAVFHTAAITPGETVAVVGCGGVGLNSIQAARIAGASTIAALDTDSSKFELARSLGATVCFDPLDAEAQREFLDLVGGGVDHAFEAVGRPAAIQTAFGLIARGGTCTTIGMAAEGQTLTIDAMALLQGRTLQGSMMGSNRFPIDVPRYAAMIESGLLDLESMISERLAFDSLVAGYDALSRGQTGRQVVLF